MSVLVKHSMRCGKPTHTHTQGAIQELRQDVGAKQDALQTNVTDLTGMIRTMSAQIAHLKVRSNDLHSNPRSNSRDTKTRMLMMQDAMLPGGMSQDLQVIMGDMGWPDLLSELLAMWMILAMKW